MEQNITKNNNDIRILSVKWKGNLVGYLMKEYDVGYLFKYDKNAVREAKNRGFVVIPGLGNINKTYISKELFQVFKSRIPSKQRRDLPEILKAIGIEGKGTDKREFDDFDYLARTKGESLTDFLSVDEDLNLANLKNRKIVANRLLRNTYGENYYSGR